MTAPTCGIATTPTIGGRSCEHTVVKRAGGSCVHECPDCTAARLCGLHWTQALEDEARAAERRQS